MKAWGVGVGAAIVGSILFIAPMTYDTKEGLGHTLPVYVFDLLAGLAAFIVVCLVVVVFVFVVATIVDLLRG